MSDKLQVEIDVAGARAALEGLTETFRGFANTAKEASSQVSASIQELNKQMAGLQALPTGVLDSITQLNNAIKNVQSGSLNEVINTMNNLGGADTIELTAKAVEHLGSALGNLKLPDNIGAINVNIKGIQDNAGGAAPEVDKLRNYVRQLGNEINHAVGYMMGFGTTAGNIVAALRSIGTEGFKVSEVIAKMRQEFGDWGTVQVALGSVAVAVKGIYDAANMLLGPVIDIGTRFNNFKIAIDAVEKSTGAGAEALEKIRGVAERTANGVLSLSQNYLKFRASTEAAGMTADSTLEIFENFGGAFRAMGLSSVEAGRGFKALEQMFSKGKVQAEELRNQLGDILPGAFSLAAEAMEITTEELNKMLETGRVLPGVMIPAMSKLLNVKFGEAMAIQARTAAAQLEMLRNRFQETVAAVAGGGGFSGALGGIAAGLRILNDSLNSESVLAFASALGTLIGLFSNTVLSTLGGFIEGLTKVTDTIFKAISAIGEFTGITKLLFGDMSNGNIIMRTVAETFNYLGQALGILTSVYVANRLGILQLIATKVSWATLNTSVLVPSLTALSRAFVFLGTAMSGGVIGLIVTAVASFVALDAAFNSSRVVIDAWNATVEFFKERLTALIAAVSVFGATFLALSPTFNTVASSFATAIGTMLTSSGSFSTTLSGTMTTAVELFKTAISGATTFIGTFWGKLAGGLAVVSLVVTGIDKLGQSMGLWSKESSNAATITSTLNTALLAIVGTYTTYNMVMGTASTVSDAWSKVAKSKIGTMLGLSKAVEALTNVWKMSPMGRAAIVVAGIAAIGTAVYQAGKHFGAWGQGAVKAAEDYTKLESSQESFTKSMESVVKMATKTSSHILALGSDIGSYADRIKQAGRDQAGLAAQTAALDKAILNQQRGADAEKRRFDARAQQYKEEEAMLSRRKKNLESAAKLEKDLDRQSSKGGGPRTSSLDDTYRTIDIERATRALGDNSRAAKDNENAYKSLAARNKSYIDSLKDKKANLERDSKSIKEWGLALSDSEQAMASQLVMFGKTKAEAAEMTATFTKMTQSEEDRAQGIRDRLSTSQQELDYYHELAKRLRTAMDERAKAMRDAGTPEEDIKREMAARTAQIRSIEDHRNAAGQLVVNLRAAEAAQKDHSTVAQTAAQAAEELNKKYGIVTDSVKAAGETFQTTNGSVKTASDALKDSGESSKQVSASTADVAEKMREADAAARKTAENIGKVSEAMANTSTSITSSKEAITETAAQYASLSESFRAMSTSLTTIPGNLGLVIQTLLASNESVPTSIMAFSALNEQFTAMSISLPIVSEAMASIVLKAMEGVEPINLFSLALARIPESEVGIAQAGESFRLLVDTITQMSEQITQAASSIAKLGSAANGVAEGFTKASRGSADFSTALNRTHDSIRTTIRLMHELKKAAEEAFKAAARAQSGGGGGGGEVTTDSSRYGGLSGNAIEKQSAPISAFNTAPKLSEGTANTSRFVSKLSGGGIPSILHPNEAVIPLSRGRKVPVDLSFNDIPATGDSTKVLATVSRKLDNVATALNRFGSPSTDAPVLKLETTVTKNVSSGEEEDFYAPPPRVVNRGGGLGSVDGATGPRAGAGAGGQGILPKVSTIGAPNVTIYVNTADADGFKRSQDQIAKSTADRIRRATNRIS